MLRSFKKFAQTFHARIDTVIAATTLNLIKVRAAFAA